MHIIINKQSPNTNYQEYQKVRAIIENQTGEIAISHEAGKIIFPGGKCETNENPKQAIKRELKEELGINFENINLSEELIIETFYNDYYDFRTKTIIPRHTITTYFYGKTNQSINLNNQSLTKDEISQKFKIFFTDKQTLIKLLTESHEEAFNGKYFDEENKIILEELLKKKYEI